MPKSTKVKVGNKAKGRRSAKNKSSGKYVRQRAITEKNRKLKQAKHLKLVEKKKTRKGLL